jgi:hypothetical protein
VQFSTKIALGKIPLYLEKINNFVDLDNKHYKKK